MPHKIAFNKHLLVAVFLLIGQSSAIAEDSTDKAIIREPESKFQSTDVLEVPSGVTAHEIWPGKLEQLMVRNFRLVNSNTQK